jgi:hypothetical protein
LEVRARKQFAQIIRGKATEPERMAAVIQFLESHPDLITPYPSSAESAILAQKLFEELAKSDDPGAVHMVLKSGHITPAFSRKHFPEMLTYAQGLTGESAVSNGPLVERLYESNDKRVIPLLEKWQPYARTEGQKSYFESALRDLRKPDKN